MVESDQAGSSRRVDDDHLIQRMLAGQAEAVDQLMHRYDRLVRYTVWRISREQCRRDPAWLDSLSSSTWTGFIRSMQLDLDERPSAVGTYLVRIARNQCVSALRRLSRRAGAPQRAADAVTESIPSQAEDPVDVVARLELLEKLKHCLNELPDTDQRLFSQLSNITERKWTAAAAALGMSESTLRSRWKGTLARIRASITTKSGHRLAPETRTGELFTDSTAPAANGSRLDLGT